MRNNVQPRVGAHPVDFIALRLPKALQMRRCNLALRRRKSPGHHPLPDQNGDLNLRIPAGARIAPGFADGSLHFRTGPAGRGFSAAAVGRSGSCACRPRNAPPGSAPGTLSWNGCTPSTKPGIQMALSRSTSNSCRDAAAAGIAREVQCAPPAAGRAGFHYLRQRSLELQRAWLQPRRKSRLAAAHLYPFRV